MIHDIGRVAVAECRYRDAGRREQQPGRRHSEPSAVFFNAKIRFAYPMKKANPRKGSLALNPHFSLCDYCGGVLAPFEGGGALVVPGLLGVVVPGLVLPGLVPELGAVLLGVPPGVVDPGAVGFCGVVSGTLPG